MYDTENTYFREAIMDYRKLTDSYQYTVTYDDHRKFYIASVEEFPHLLINDYNCPEDALDRIKECVVLILPTLAALGREIPNRGDKVYFY